MRQYAAVCGRGTKVTKYKCGMGKVIFISDLIGPAHGKRDSPYCRTVWLLKIAAFHRRNKTIRGAKQSPITSLCNHTASFYMSQSGRGDASFCVLQLVALSPAILSIIRESCPEGRGLARKKKITFHIAHLHFASLLSLWCINNSPRVTKKKKLVFHSSN